MRKFIESKGWWSQEEEEAMKATQKKTVLKAFQDTEKLLKPSLKELFTDVYDKPPWNLVDIIASCPPCS
jgi:2-oxoisovalerate dehydrogenase E1 component alpha subunit